MCYIKLYLIVFLIVFFVQLYFILSYFYKFSKKYLFTNEINLTEKYGTNTWVIVTGCSSGQGELICYEFAKRNFNIILMGYKGIKKVEKIINDNFKNIKTIRCVTNFCKAYKKNYFKKIESILDNLDGELSFLVNNIGHRTAWYPYHEMPEQKINDTIVCGTIVQSRLTQIAIKHFENRKNKEYKSGIINITSMCMHTSTFFGMMNYISIPYLSVYEAANAFGFYHSNSIQKEYEKTIDILNITPGAVITSNTPYLKNVWFSINSDQYVKNIFKLIGNYTGPQCSYWKHEISSILYPFVDSDNILLQVGKLISNEYMSLIK